MLKLALLAGIVALQVADVVSTGYALAAPGIVEANPMMGWAQQALGSFWWAPKLAFVPLGLWCLGRAPQTWPAALVASCYAAVVAGNIVNSL